MSERVTTPGSARGIARHAIKIAAYSRDRGNIAHAVNMTVRTLRRGEHPKRNLDPTFADMRQKLALPNDPRETHERLATLDLIYDLVHRIVEFDRVRYSPPLEPTQEFSAG